MVMEDGRAAVRQNATNCIQACDARAHIQGQYCLKELLGIFARHLSREMGHPGEIGLMDRLPVNGQIPG